MYQFMKADAAQFAELERRANTACAVFHDQALPPGCSPARARVGFEVTPATGEARLFVDRGIAYSGSNPVIRAWLTTGVRSFPSFTSLISWIRTDLAAAYQHEYAMALPRVTVPVAATSSIVAPDFAPHLPAAVSAAYVLAPIVQQRLQRVLSVSAEKQLPVHHSFNAPLFTGTVIIPGKERDWHLMPISEDPTWGNRHGYPMPKAVISTLRTIERANLDIDTIFVAHEAPKGVGLLPGPAERSAAFTPPISMKAQQSAASMGTAAANLIKAAFAPALLTGVAGAALGAAAVIATGALVGLDPILMGTISDSRNGLKVGSPAAWVYLAHWNWE